MKEKDNIHKGHRQRMQEKFNEVGFKGWSEVEVIEYMLYNVYRQGDTNPVAHRLLKYNGDNIVELMRASTNASMMSEIPGVGEKTMSFLRSIKEFMDYYHKKELKYEPVKYEVGNILDVIEFVEFDPGKESLKMICLDSQAYVRAMIDLTEYGGDLEATTTKTAVAKAISLHGAAAVLFLHNHPTGEVMPSYMDSLTTAKLERMLSMENVVLLDHIIVCGNKAWSYVTREEYIREVED